MKTDKRLVIASVLVILAGAQAHAAFLLGADVVTDGLAAIDSSTLNAQLIGSFSGPVITGLAYDNTSDVLYGISPSADAIYTVNQQSGAASFVVSVNTGGNPNGLAFDPNSGVLYMTDNNSNGLFRYNVTTAQLQLVGTIAGGFSSVEGLAYDPSTNTLYGLADNQDRIVRINTTTAQATGLPNSLGFGIWRGLGFDSSNGVLWATRVNAGAPLTRVDPVTGLGTDVGTITGTGDFNFIQGIAVVPEPSSLLLVMLGLTGTLPLRRRKRLLPPLT